MTVNPSHLPQGDTEHPDVSLREPVATIGDRVTSAMVGVVFGLANNSPTEPSFEPVSARQHISSGKSIDGREIIDKPTPEAEVALGDLIVALEVVKEEIIASKGESLGDALVSGISMPIYIRGLTKRFSDIDYHYIMDSIRPIIEEVEVLHESFLTRKTPGKHVRMPHEMPLDQS